MEQQKFQSETVVKQPPKRDEQQDESGQSRDDSFRSRSGTIKRSASNTLKKTKELSSNAIGSLRMKKDEFVKNRQEKKEKREREKQEYSEFSKRMQSFNENTMPWPHQKPSPEDCAAAGLYFTPKEKKVDRCKCYSCGHKFSSWLPVDEPKK